GGHGPREVADVLVATGLDHLEVDADLLEEALELGELDQHADGAGQGAGVGDDVVGGDGQVVAAGGGQRAHRDHDDLALLAHAGDGVVDLLARPDDAAGALDADDDGPDRGVLEVLLQLADDRLGIDDEALDLDQGDAVAAERPLAALGEHQE